MIIDGKTKLLGLIGNPVEHTMSPAIHNTIAKHMKENMAYLPFPVKEDLGAAVKGAYALGVQGMNVTVPYKSDVMDFLVDIDKQARVIGAVNTLVRSDGGYKGYNTDLPGLYRALKSEGIEINGAEVIILGAGGAARAAAFMCAFYQAKMVYLLNRTVEKAVSVADEVKEKTGFINIVPMSLADYEKIPGNGYLVLQATKVGLYSNVEETPIEEAAFFEKVSVVYDLIYTPAETKFMHLAKECGAKAYNGLKMLLYQGVAGYEMWNQVSVPEEIVQKAYEALVNKLIAKKIILIGFMGCGKTSIGKRLSEALGIPFLDTDELIEAEQKKSISSIFEEEGEAAFRAMETECLRKLLNSKENCFVLSVGGGLPVREENRKLLSQIGHVVYLKVSPETVYKRLRNDKTRPLLQGANPRGRIWDLMNARKGFYESAAASIVEADDKEFNDIIEEIKEKCQ